MHFLDHHRKLPFSCRIHAGELCTIKDLLKNEVALLISKSRKTNQINGINVTMEARGADFSTHS